MAKLSAFADEISPELDVQLENLNKHGVEFIELRSVWGKNVLALCDQEVEKVKKMADDAGVGFSAVGSPIGKFPLDGDHAEEIERTKRAIEIAHKIGCRYIRMFSYSIPKGDDPMTHRDQCIDWVGRLVEVAEGTDVKLALENEKNIYADTGERQLDMLAAIDSPSLVGIFDPANFVQCGEHPYEDCWRRLKGRIEYFHIKDARLEDRKVVPAGEGDGDVPRILTEAFASGFNNFLTLEPHLKVAGASHGETGPELFGVAVQALRNVLEGIGAE